MRGWQILMHRVHKCHKAVAALGGPSLVVTLAVYCLVYVVLTICSPSSTTIAVNHTQSREAQGTRLFGKPGLKQIVIGSGAW